MTDLILITTTNSDKDELSKIADHLIQNRLAACCQISGPITSCYTWDNQQETAQEWVCSIKTTKHSFDRVAEAIEQLHHYDEPQITAVDIISASPSYRQWVINSVSR